MVICDHTKIFLQAVLLLILTKVEILTVLRVLLVQLILFRVQPVKMDMENLQIWTIMMPHHVSVSTDGDGKLYTGICVNTNHSNLEVCIRMVLIF